MKLCQLYTWFIFTDSLCCCWPPHQQQRKRELQQILNKPSKCTLFFTASDVKLCWLYRLVSPAVTHPLSGLLRSCCPVSVSPWFCHCHTPLGDQQQIQSLLNSMGEVNISTDYDRFLSHRSKYMTRFSQATQPLIIFSV